MRDERDILLDRIESEGPIFPTDRGGLGIFDPATAIALDNANTSSLVLRPLPLDAPLPPVPWRTVRAPLIERSRQLTRPEVLRAMHLDMRSALLAATGKTTDLALLAGRTAIHVLIPAIFGTVARADCTNLVALQDHRLQRQIDSPFRRQSVLSEWRNRLREVRSGRLIARLVASRSARPIDPDDVVLIDSLIEMRDVIGPGRVNYLAQTLLIAASTAPAILSACMLHTLASKPALREAIAAEILNLPDGALYTDAGRRPMQATKAFIAESLRLWTFPMLTGRTATVRHEAGDHIVERDDPYTLSAYVTHRCPHHWPDAETFDPTRWDDDQPRPERGTYLPFGFGSRTCIASSLAEAQLYLLCALFAHDFDAAESVPGASQIVIGTIPFPRNFIGQVFCAEGNFLD